MRAIKEWLSFWKLALATTVIACFNPAFAQTSYQVTDLGALNNGVFGCAMGLNNQGWTEAMEGYLDASGNFVGRAVMNLAGSQSTLKMKIDLGTLGGPNSWINWGGINDRGDAVGFAETGTPDPNGEDICEFGTGLTCRPFIWRAGQMSALPTLGGNNGQASAINKQGQVTGAAENTTPDSTCINTSEVFQMKPVIWTDGAPKELPTVAGDPDGFVIGINDKGQAVGSTGGCGVVFGPGPHAVLWENRTAVELKPTLGSTSSNAALAINNKGWAAGTADNADDTTFYAVLWRDGTVINLGTVSGDFASLATGINDQGQVVGTSFDSSFNPVHGFIWQNGVMIDLNTLFPASSNLYATMANKINSRGQISGMATVLSGPNAGEVHDFLATPVHASLGASVAAVTHVHPKSNLPANVRKQLLRGLGLDRFGR